MEPEEARKVFYGQLAEWRAGGKWNFTVEDLFPIRQKTGKSRPWLYMVLGQAQSDNIIHKDGRGQWAINKAA
jgi:hypothetical protein